MTDRINFFLKWILVLFSLVVFSLSLYHFYLVVICPYGIAYAEAFFLNQIVTLLAGEALYGSLEVPPYLLTSNPPLYPLAVSILQLFFDPSFIAGRVFSLICLIISAFIAARLVFGQSSAAESILAFVLVVSAPFFLMEGVLLSPDMLSLLLVVLGIYCVERSLSERGVFVASIFLALSLGASFKLIVAPLAVTIYLLIKESSLALRFLIIFLAALLVQVLVYFSIFGSSIIEHLFSFSTFQLSLDGIWLRTLELFSVHHVLLLGGVVGAIYFLVVRRERLIAIYFFLALAFQLLAGEQGFYGGVIFAASILVARLMIRSAALETSILRSLFPGLLVFYFLHIFQWPDLHNSHSPSAQFLSYAEKVKIEVQTAKGPVFMSEAGHLVVANIRPFLDPISVVKLREKGIWQKEKLAEKFAEKYFKKVILGTASRGGLSSIQLYSKDALMRLEMNYTLTRQFGQFRVFEPKSENT